METFFLIKQIRSLP